jgi:hypothetical protein
MTGATLLPGLKTNILPPLITRAPFAFAAFLEAQKETHAFARIRALWQWQRGSFPYRKRLV